MSCMKCDCGCDKFSKEELEELLHACDKKTNFLNNQTAQDVFLRVCSPDEPDRYGQQPSGSKLRSGGNPPEPKAIKYFKNLKEADGMLRRLDNLSDEEVVNFANRVPDENLGEELENSTSTNREEILQAIVTEYYKLLIETDQYKKYEKKLIAAYNGKIKIKKP